MEDDDDNSFSFIGPIPAMVYILCSFIANVGSAITGYGQALIFVFVYTVFDIFGMMVDCQPNDLCGVKYAVCLQTLSLVGSVPLLMYQSNPAKHANRYLLTTLIPVTLVSTPFGQWCQDYVSSSVIRLVVGVVVTAVVGYELYKLCKQRRVPNTEETPITATPTTELTPLLSVTEDKTDDEKDPLLHGFTRSSIFIWGVVLGFLSGFLGGLIGMRGPPLMIFFLQFPFPKGEARSIGAILLLLNMVLRMGYYLFQDYQHDHAQQYGADSSTTKWFYWKSSWHLYVGIVVAGVLGVPIGDCIHHRMDQSNFRLALAIILAFSGVVNIVKAVEELQHR
jgi:uncharacterized membrane protein YfcA